MKRFLHIAISFLIAAATLSCSESAREERKENIIFGINADGYTIERKRVESGEAWSKILGSYGIGSQKVIQLDRLTKNICPLRNIQAGSHYTAFTKQDSTRTHLDYLVYEKNLIRWRFGGSAYG